MWRGPEHPGEFPTLGFDVLDWIEEWLVVPDGPLAGEPLILTPEQAQFVIRYYRVDLASGKRSIRRGVLSRPKGWGKSPLLAALCIARRSPRSSRRVRRRRRAGRPPVGRAGVQGEGADPRRV
jgi:hypothetical protein